MSNRKDSLMIEKEEYRNYINAENKNLSEMINVAVAFGAVGIVLTFGLGFGFIAGDVWNIITTAAFFSSSFFLLYFSYKHKKSKEKSDKWLHELNSHIDDYNAKLKGGE